MSSITSDTYRRYKLGTETTFTWLSDALDKADITLDRNLEDISIRSLLHLASQAQRSGASMPYEVIHSLEDSLKIRRQYHTWYSKQISQKPLEESNKSIKKSNESHQAFIDVLQYIHDLFVPATVPAVHQIPHGASSEKLVELTNLFANLETEDMAELEDDDQAVKTVNQPSDPPPAVKPLVSKKARDLTEDKFLELYCLYDDANKIREYLRKKWAEYSSRKVDIISAAIATQEALELFAEIEESYDFRHGSRESRYQSSPLPKFFDLFGHLSARYQEDRNRTEKSSARMTKSGEAAAKLLAQSPDGEHEREAGASGWTPSDELDAWVLRPGSYALLRMSVQPDDWLFKQAFRTTAERSGDFDAILEHSDLSLRAASKEMLDIFVDIYAGVVFLRNNPTAIVTPGDIVTTMWNGQYDASISKFLAMHVLHDIHTAKPESGQVDILTQVSEDYKRLGGDVALFSRYLGGDENELPEKLEFLKDTVEKERSWLQGRVPGRIDLPNRDRKRRLQKLQELPLKTNPVLAGMVLFHLSYNCCMNRISSVNNKWFLVPLAHVINWLAVAYGEATADFLKIWPDLHTALGMIGPRPVWKGSGPPEDTRTCRNRMLLLWGLPLKEFYQRMAIGDIPNAEELFTRIKKNEAAGIMLAENGRGMMLRGSSQASLNEPDRRANQLLRIEASQSMPLLDAVRENLYTHGLMKAQQSHIRKIVLASTAVDGSANISNGSPSKQKKGRQELDMLSYIDAFSRVAQAEIPHLMFPLSDVADECAMVASVLLRGIQDEVTIPPDMWECVAMNAFKPASESERMARFREQKWGEGAQSLCSLLALITMFGDGAGNFNKVQLQRHVLEQLEEGRKGAYQDFNNYFTKKFVKECKELGFVVPECAAEALSSGKPDGQST